MTDKKPENLKRRGFLLAAPLAAQQALLENLVDGVREPDRDALGEALDQTERLSALVDDLLDVGRIESGTDSVAGTCISTDLTGPHLKSPD